MRRSISVVLLAALLLTGCSQNAPAQNQPTAEEAVAESSTPTATPTPEMMTVEAAGENYLDAVCAVNVLIPGYQAEEDRVWNAGDLTTLKGLAGEMRDTLQTSAGALSDTEVLWPSDLAESAAAIGDQFYAQLGYFQQVTTVDYQSALQAIIFPESTPEADAAGPKIRSVLGLSTDPQASCADRA
jgi:hypothetical protein